MKIISVRVRNTTTRAPEKSYDGETTTPRMAFDDAGIPMGTNVSLNGTTIAQSQYDTPISNLTEQTEVLLASVVKADGAC